MSLSKTHSFCSTQLHEFDIDSNIEKISQEIESKDIALLEIVDELN